MLRGELTGPDAWESVIMAPPWLFIRKELFMWGFIRKTMSGKLWKAIYCSSARWNAYYWKMSAADLSNFSPEDYLKSPEFLEKFIAQLYKDFSRAGIRIFIEHSDISSLRKSIRDALSGSTDSQIRNLFYFLDIPESVQLQASPTEYIILRIIQKVLTRKFYS